MANAFRKKLAVFWLALISTYFSVTTEISGKYDYDNIL